MDKRDVYYYSLTGALGGLIAWFVAGWVLDYLVAEQHLVRMAQIAIKGALVGAGVGGALCSRERARNANWQMGLRDGALGGLTGALGGAVSSLLGAHMFTQFGQNLTGRVVGYLLLGTMIGVGEGLKWLVWGGGGGSRGVRGAMGGALGGAAAAVVFHLLSQSVSSTLGDSLSYVAIGLLLGAGVSSAVMVGNMAVLYVVESPQGKLQGQRLPLGTHGPRDVIGSDGNVSVPMITDDDMALHHAEIITRGRAFYLSPLPGDRYRPGHVWVNGEPLVGEVALHGGEMISLGKTTFQFLVLSDAVVVRKQDGIFRPETDADKAKALDRGNW